MVVQMKLSLPSVSKAADLHSFSFSCPGRTMVPTEFGEKGIRAALG